MKSNNRNDDQNFPKSSEFNENQTLRNPEIDLLHKNPTSSLNVNCEVLKDVKTDLDIEIEECLKVFEIKWESSKSDTGNSEKSGAIRRKNNHCVGTKNPITVLGADCITSSLESMQESNAINDVSAIHSEGFHKSVISSNRESNPGDIKVIENDQESIPKDLPPKKRIKLETETSRCNNLFKSPKISDIKDNGLINQEKDNLTKEHKILMISSLSGTKLEPLQCKAPAILNAEKNAGSSNEITESWEKINDNYNIKSSFRIKGDKNQPILYKDNRTKIIDKEFEDCMSNDSKVESSIVENLQSSNFFEGDTLILQCEESDIDSELEKCYELFNANEHQETTSIYEGIDSDKKINVTDYINADTSECTSDNVNISNLNNDSNKLEISKLTNESKLSENTDMEQNLLCDNDSCLIIHEESDIDSEIEKCNKLLFSNHSDLENKLTKEYQKNNTLSNNAHINHFDKTEMILEQEVNFQNNSSNVTNLNIKNNEEINLKYNINEIKSNFITNEKINFEFNCNKKNSSITDKEKFNVKDNFKSDDNIKNVSQNFTVNENKVSFKDNSINNNEKMSNVNITIDEKVKFKNNNEENSNTTDTIHEDRVIFKDISKSNRETNCNTELIVNDESKLDEKFYNSKITPEKSNEKDSNISKTNEDMAIFKDNLKNGSEKNCDTNLTVNDKLNLNRKSPNSKITIGKNHPERIFKLAIGSLNSVLNTNTNLNSPCKVKISSKKSCSPYSNKKEHCEKDLKLNEQQKELNNQVKDYLEDEKDDIINPEWQAVKNLSTNEERYRQVRNCWKSKTIPDPNKNLTYHSYRKRLFQSRKIEVHPIKHHKRHASSDLNKRNAKRPCTFFLDKEIDSIRQTKDKEKEAIITEMHDKISIVDEQIFQRQNSMQPGYNHNSYRCNNNYDGNKQSYSHFDNRVSVIANEYNKIVDCCEHKFENQIGTLNERRNEVLKFYSFYKGLNDSEDDPTLLTESQFQELDEIENVYRHFNHYYK